MEPKHGEIVRLSEDAGWHSNLVGAKVWVDEGRKKLILMEDRGPYEGIDWTKGKALSYDLDGIVPYCPHRCAECDEPASEDDYLCRSCRRNGS